MDKILEIDVEITGANNVEGKNRTIVMIEFKGVAKGPSPRKEEYENIYRF